MRERYLVTGSAGHLGEALVRTLRDRGDDVVGLDLLASPTTTHVGSVADPDAVTEAMDGVSRVLHTATLHKPHIGSHSRRAFVEVNVTGTLTVLERAAAAKVRGVVLTSSTSAFGRALTPAPGEPASWITEDVVPRVRNVYGATKVAAEDLGELAAREDGLPVVVLRTSRFFPERDDRDEVRAAYDDTHLKVLEFLYRRVDLADVVDAHLLAAHHRPEGGFARFVVSATTPFTPEDRPGLGVDAGAVLEHRAPDVAERLTQRGWAMLPRLDRVYVNDRARAELGWAPRTDAAATLDRIDDDGDWRGPLARTVGAKGYHPVPTGVYTT